MKKNKYPPASTQINRNFYTNLRNNGRSYDYIMELIKPERKTQFRIDIMSLLEESKKPSFFQKFLNLFK